jgi:HEAT repeat protein
MARLALLAVLLAAPGLHARADDEPASPALLVERLRSRYLREREAAAAELAKMGEDALEHVTPLINDADARVRRAAVDILCQIGTLKSIQPLLPLLAGNDESLKEQIRNALMAVGRPIRKTLEEAIADGSDAAAELRELLDAMTTEDLEKIFESQITSDGSSGFYAGQFAAVKELGADAGPVLLRMFSETGFNFRRAGDRGYRFRMMAADAMAEIGYKEAIPKLKEVAEDRSMFGKSAAYALYRLGEKEAVEKLEKQLLEEVAAEAPRGIQSQARSDLAELYARIGDNEKSLEAWRSCMAADSSQARICRYNMACALSMMGRKKEALAELRRAVDAGFVNAEWMTIDRDLDSIRSEPEYQAILRELGGGNAELPPEPSQPGGGAD